MSLHAALPAEPVHQALLGSQRHGLCLQAACSLPAACLPAGRSQDAPRPLTSAEAFDERSQAAEDVPRPLISATPPRSKESITDSCIQDFLYPGIKD